MSKMSEELTLKMAAQDALAACRDAVAMVGWKPAGATSDDRVIAKFGFGFFSNPGRVEMLVAQAGEESRVVLNASIKQIGPVADGKLRKQLAQIRSAIEASALRYGGASASSDPAPSSPSTGDAGQEPESVEERLAKLAEMHKQSLITDAEYEEQRRRVLGSL